MKVVKLDPSHMYVYTLEVGYDTIAWYLNGAEVRRAVDEYLKRRSPASADPERVLDNGAERILAKIQHLHELLERYERERQHWALLEDAARIEGKLDAYNAREGK